MDNFDSWYVFVPPIGIGPVWVMLYNLFKLKSIKD